MKAFIVVVALLLVGEGHAQPVRCLETHFSGEVTQGDAFRKELGSGIEFSVNSASLKEAPWWSWFSIRVIRSSDGIFASQPSDTNWALAINNFGTVFIGGPRTDLRAALGYRSRYLLFPLSPEDLLKARQATELARTAQSKGQYQKALAALKAARLAHAEFEITDYGLGPGEPPTTVEWLRFDIKLTVPSAFTIAAELPVATVDCPAIPASVLDDIQHPKRFQYWLPGTG
jgi:hypothetical protein